MIQQSHSWVYTQKKLQFKKMHPYFQSSITDNSQDMETT